MPFPPERIVCLTEETVETLYLLGEEARIVGVSGYAVRPPRVRREKPRVSAFTSADLPKILELQPDLVLAFSDLQAEIIAALIRAGVAVHAFNQRDVAGILAMIRLLGALAAGYERRLAQVRAEARRAQAGRPRPRAYFEEWDAPMISAIGWVSELIEIAGGENAFAGLARAPDAAARIVSPEAVAAAAPDVILASWCGKKVRPERIAARPGFDAIPAVRQGRIREIKSPLILQPGPATLTDGLDATLLQWSFVRDDQPRAETCRQIGLAIRDEVLDLEAAGLPAIQIDEPALREGLPLRRADWAAYLRWAVDAFRLAAAGVRDETQIHTHMCYAEFNEVLPAIAEMDADVISIETSRSDMELLRAFADFAYPNEIGPGAWDIHSPRVPSEAEIVGLLRKALAVIPAERLWVNPDCGLKTRGWPEVEASIRAMVAAARRLRAEARAAETIA